MALPHRRALVVVCSALATVLAPADGRGIGADRAGCHGCPAPSFNAQGRALICSGPRDSRDSLLAWGAIDARAPTQAQAQVAFNLQYGGPIGANLRGVQGPPLPGASPHARRRPATTGRSRPGSGCCRTTASPSSGDRRASELRLSHWSGPIARAEVWTDWSYRSSTTSTGGFTYREAGSSASRSTVRRSARTRTVASFVDTLGALPGPVEAREQLSWRPQADRRLCYGFYPHGGQSRRQRQALPGDGDRPRSGLTTRRDVGGPCAGRVRRRRRRRGERGPA